MDFIKTLLVLLKRWYVALPVFAIAVGAAGIVYASVPVRYSSNGTVVLTAPTAGASSGQASAERGQTNPLLAFDSSLSITASIVIQSMGTPQVAMELGAGPDTGNPDTTFEVSSGELGGPFIVVQTEASSPDRARNLVQTVVDRVRKELDARQKTLKAPPSTFIKADQVVPASVPERLLGGKMRAAGAALALGLFASLGSAFGIESVLARRRSKPKDEKPAKDKKQAAKDPTDVDDDDPPRSVSGTIDEPHDDRTVIMPRVHPLNGTAVKTNGSTKTVPTTSPVVAAGRPVRRQPDGAADKS